MAALYTNNEPSVRGTKKTIPFTITTQKIKYLGINLTKEEKDLYSDDYRTLKNEVEEHTNNGNIYHVHRLEELTSLKCPYYPKQSIDSM